jgi:hypothetical protein
MFNVVKKRSNSKDYIYCVYSGARLILQTRNVAAAHQWLKLNQA